MKNTLTRRLVTAGLLLTAALITACGDETPRVVGPSAPDPQGPPPSITSVTPATSSTAGGASMRIVGTGFRSGTVAVFDGVRVAARFDSRDTAHTTMYVETPPHAAGTIDIVVTNPDGLSDRMAGGHTYVAPETFDPNGEWAGEAWDGSHRGMLLVIQGGRLLRASCFGMTAVTPLTPAEPVTLAGGSFTLFQDGHEVMTGRSVASNEMIGTMNFGECGAMFWRASPRPQ